MGLTPRAGIAVAEIIVYVPCAVALVFALFRHGLGKRVGTYYLVTFTILRLTGAGLEIAADKDPSNQNLFAWASILQAIGISALLLAALGLLMRIIDMTSTHVRSDPMSKRNVFFRQLRERTFIIGHIVHKFISAKATATARRSRVIQLLQFPALAGLIICIIGGTDLASNNPSTVSQGMTLFKAGIGLFLGIYAVLVIFTMISALEFGKIPRGERRVMIAVIISIPLLTVRMLLAILAVYTTLKDFQYFNGSAVVDGLMGTLEEFLVVIMFVGVVLTIPRYRPAYLVDEDRRRGNGRVQKEVESNTTLTRLEPENVPSVPSVPAGVTEIKVGHGAT